MSEIDKLFEEALQENNISLEPLTLAEKVVQRAEEEFRGYSGEEKSRRDEEEEIRDCIKILEGRLLKNKNIKNHKLVHLNAKRSEKRKEIKKKIIFLQLRLQEINDERGDRTKTS